MPVTSLSPETRPDAIDVPVIATVAGPGLALASRAATRIRGRFKPIRVVGLALERMLREFCMAMAEPVAELGHAADPGSHSGVSFLTSMV